MAHIPKNICFLSDSHKLYDDRIYWKEAVSLKKAGYEVWHIFVGEKQERGITKEGIHFIGLKLKTYSSKRIQNYLLKRMSADNLYFEMLNEAANVNADVYHLHDLKLNKIGNKLKKLPQRPRIIYDVHEPHSENILDYFETKGIFSILKRFYAAYIKRWEIRKTRNYDFIITTEENICKHFQQYHKKENVDIVYNYTNLQGDRKIINYDEKEYDAIYCGGITKHRGAWQILKAVKIAVKKKNDLKVLFLGSWFPQILKQQMGEFIESNDLSKNIFMHDSVPYHQVCEFYNTSKIGLGIFLPIRTHKIILQIKIFEYMNFGLPIIGSNFGHINNYINDNDVGISVDPTKPEEISNALIRLLSNYEMYNQFSNNGIKAVDSKYNWVLMENKLLRIYKRLLE